MPREMNAGNVVTAAALAWSVPGAGHCYLGQWKKGLFFFLILTAAYGTGLILCGGGAISFEENPFYFVGRYGSGATWFSSSFLLAREDVPGDTSVRVWFDPGLLYMCIAGMLNALVVLSIFNPGLSHWRRKTQARFAAQPAPAAEVPAPVSIPPPDPGREGGGGPP